MKTVETIIRERPDCVNPVGRDIPSPALGSMNMAGESCQVPLSAGVHHIEVVQNSNTGADALAELKASGVCGSCTKSSGYAASHIVSLELCLGYAGVLEAGRVTLHVAHIHSESYIASHIECTKPLFCHVRKIAQVCWKQGRRMRHATTVRVRSRATSRTLNSCPLNSTCWRWRWGRYGQVAPYLLMGVISYK